MMDRRAFIQKTSAAAGALLGLGGKALAADKPFRIYMMLFRGWEEACDGFRDYFAAREIPVELIVRDAKQQRSAIPEMVREAKDLRPDLVYVWGTQIAVAALGRWNAPDPKLHITNLPVVFNIVGEPVENGIVQSLERPGRNATGTVYVAPIKTQLNTMTAYRAFKRVGVIYSPAESSSVLTVKALEQASGPAGFELLALPVPLNAAKDLIPESLPELVQSLKQRQTDWLYVPTGTTLQVHRVELTNAALEARLPSFAATERFISFANGLAGLVCRYYNIGQFTGFKAEQILRGMKPEAIPVQTLNRFSFIINMRTANTLRFYPPLSMLSYAETV